MYLYQAKWGFFLFCFYPFPDPATWALWWACIMLDKAFGPRIYDGLASCWTELWFALFWPISLFIRSVREGCKSTRGKKICKIINNLLWWIWKNHLTRYFGLFAVECLWLAKQEKINILMVKLGVTLLNRMSLYLFQSAKLGFSKIILKLLLDYI